MRARILGGLGAALTLAAAAVLVRPDLADSLSEVVAVLESQDPKRLLLVLGSVVGAYAAWAARTGSSERPPEDGPAAQFSGVGDPPEAVSAADRTRTGASFDDRTAAACSGDESAMDAVRSTLAETAASAHARAADRPPEEAHRVVETGAWTDDPTAAAFLAGDGGPGFSLWSRLRAWLDPETERRRRVERTVEAVSRELESGGDARGETESGEIGRGGTGRGETGRRDTERGEGGHGETERRETERRADDGGDSR